MVPPSNLDIASSYVDSVSFWHLVVAFPEFVPLPERLLFKSQGDIVVTVDSMQLDGVSCGPYKNPGESSGRDQSRMKGKCRVSRVKRESAVLFFH